MESGRAKLSRILFLVIILKAHGAPETFGWLSDVAYAIRPSCSITSSTEEIGENLLQTTRNVAKAKTASLDGLHSHVHSKQAMFDLQRQSPSPKLNENLLSLSPAQDPTQRQLCIPEFVPSFHVAFGMTLLGMLCVGLLSWMLVISCENSTETPCAQAAPAPRPDKNSTPQGDRTSRPILKSLDGLRTFLVSWIILYHMDGLPSSVGSHWPVHYFFVLSGFIMFYVVEGKRAHFDFRAGRAFVVRRLARLCPVYFLALLWMAAIMYHHGENLRPFSAWPAQSIFLQSLFPLEICGMGWDHRLDYGGNTVGWFTSASVLLSFCFPLLYNARPQSGFHGTFYVLFAVVLVRSFIPLITNNFIFMHPWVVMRLPEYVAGMLAAQLCGVMPKHVSEWKGWGLVFDGSLFFGAAVVAALVHSHDPRLAVSRTCHGDYFLTSIFCVTCIAARFAAEPSEEKIQGLLYKLFSSRPMTSMAEFSFSAYIVQTAVSKTVPNFLGGHAGDVMSKIIAIWILGVVVTHVLERPILRIVEQRLQSRGMLTRVSGGSK